MNKIINMTWTLLGNICISLQIVWYKIKLQKSDFVKGDKCIKQQYLPHHVSQIYDCPKC